MCTVPVPIVCHRELSSGSFKSAIEYRTYRTMRRPSTDSPAAASTHKSRKMPTGTVINDAAGFGVQGLQIVLQPQVATIALKCLGFRVKELFPSVK